MNKPVVVGLDDSPSATSASRFAASYALDLDTASRTVRVTDRVDDRPDLVGVVAGSVSLSCLSHAGCPVIAIPAPTAKDGTQAASIVDTPILAGPPAHHAEEVRDAHDHSVVTP